MRSRLLKPGWEGREVGRKGAAKKCNELLVWLRKEGCVVQIAMCGGGVVELPLRAIRPVVNLGTGEPRVIIELEGVVL